MKTRSCIQNNEITVSLSLRQSKNNYFPILNEKDIVDNKLFWKTVKPLLSDKNILKDKINLSENGQIIKKELETVEVLNNFSQTLKILKSQSPLTMNPL